MDENRVSGSYLVICEGKGDSVIPMYFGVSCAFLALQILDGADKGDEKWSGLCDKMLQGSAQLLGLLVWRIQEQVNREKCELLRKLESAGKEIEELKKRRHEDAKANEKVVGIFASQEQCWLNERRNLRRQIGALINELRVLEKKKDEATTELRKEVEDMKLMLQSKEKAVEDESLKRKEVEERLLQAEKIAEDLREATRREALEHSADTRRQKTAFIELVSNQRQLEAKLGRALRQVEAKKVELNSMEEQKEESVLLAQNLSMEMHKMQKDLEQKDKILSAMLRKSKLDNAEKQTLLKEVKFTKTKKKHAETSKSRHEKHSLRNLFTSDAISSSDTVSHSSKSRSQSIDFIFSNEHLELKMDLDFPSSLPEVYSPNDDEELVTANVKRLEGWVRLEAEKYLAAIEKQHHLELEAFAEQMRQKDEKIEAFYWRLLSMELESNRLQSNAEGLNQDASHLRNENTKLEALLFEREEDLKSLKQHFGQQSKSLSSHKTNWLNQSSHNPSLTHGVVQPKVKVTKKRTVEKDQDSNLTSVELSHAEKKEETQYENRPRNTRLIVRSPENEFVEEIEVSNRGLIYAESTVPERSDVQAEIASGSQSSRTENSLWKMDLQAFGVSYKVKRLKQQLLMVERLTGNQESGDDAESKDNGKKSFLLFISLLNKQVSRFQSLQVKVDDLCKRMHENNLQTNSVDYGTTRNKGDTKTLEHFLEETFQLQRYIVATGQKMMEIQSKIASGFIGVELDKSVNFDTKRFSESIRSLFMDVQRGLEVRIARIIGDLEGTLACEGMVDFRRGNRGDMLQTIHGMCFANKLQEHHQQTLESTSYSLSYDGGAITACSCYR